jgi:signal transduction histidine kinase
VRARRIHRLLLPARRLLSSRRGRIVLTVALALAAAIEAGHAPPRGEESSTTAAIVLNALAVVPLIAARRRPFSAAVAATLVSVAILDVNGAPLTVPGFGVTLFLVAQLVVRRGLVFAVPLLLPFVENARAPFDGDYAGPGSASPLLLLLAALVVGEAMRKRALAVAALDLTQEAMAESVRAQTVMEERARIARELHDIVAHHLSVIAIESETARLTSPGLSPDTGGRLEAIASTAREALTETRRLLGVLREDAQGEAERRPQPGLGELNELIEKARATGTEVRLTQQGEVARLPLSIDLAAYRIVQEALTNARRHAPGAEVEVEVSYCEQALQLRVRDHGPGALGGEPAEGHGLMGMRERATLAGGSLSSGAVEGGGFAVDVTLPTTESAP